MRPEQSLHHATSIKKSRVTRFLKGKSRKILTYIEKYLLRGRPPDWDLLPLKMYAASCLVSWITWKLQQDVKQQKKEKSTIQRCNCANKTTENKLNKTSRNIGKMRRILNTVILWVKKDLKNQGDKFTFQTHKRWRHSKGLQKSSTTDMVMRIFCKMRTIEGHKHALKMTSN